MMDKNRFDLLLEQLKKTLEILTEAAKNEGSNHFGQIDDSYFKGYFEGKKDTFEYVVKILTELQEAENG